MSQSCLREREKKPLNKPRWVINTIIGGFVQGGATTYAKKRHLRQVWSVNTVSQHRAPNMPPITFMSDDFKAINLGPHFIRFTPQSSLIECPRPNHFNSPSRDEIFVVHRNHHNSTRRLEDGQRMLYDQLERPRQKSNRRRN